MKEKNFDRNFVLMVIGQVVSVLGSAVLRFALDLYILDITGRADIFAVVMAISMIPFILLSPIGGAIADRVNRRNLMVIFDFSSSAVILGLILLFWAGNATVVGIAVIMTLLSAITAMYQPAVQASIPVLVKEKGLAQANGLVSGISAISGIVGPVMGGILLYGIIGLQSLIWISCAAFFLSAVMEMFIKIPFTKAERHKHIVPTILGDMKEGVVYLARKNKRMFKAILLAPLLNMFMTAFLMTGGPYVLRITLDSGNAMYGTGLALVQLAGIAGALMAGAFAPKMKLETLYKWMYALAALLLPMALALTPAVLGLGYWPPFVLFTVFAMAIMLAASLISIFVITEIQKATPNALLGKIMALVLALSQCAMPVGSLLYGAALEGFSGRVYISALIAAVFTFGVAVAGKRMLRAGTEPDAPATHGETAEASAAV